MDVTRRLRSIEKTTALVRFNTFPISYPRQRFERLLSQARTEGVSLEPWRKRITALAAKLGHPVSFGS